MEPDQTLWEVPIERVVGESSRGNGWCGWCWWMEIW